MNSERVIPWLSSFRYQHQCSRSEPQPKSLVTCICVLAILWTLSELSVRPCLCWLVSDGQAAKAAGAFIQDTHFLLQGHEKKWQHRAVDRECRRVHGIHCAERAWWWLGDPISSNRPQVAGFALLPNKGVHALLETRCCQMGSAIHPS